MNHPVIKAGFEIGAVSAISSYWLGYIQGIVALIATTATAIYYILHAYYLYKEKQKNKD